MKKIISLVLAILMIAMVMVSCKKDGTGSESSTPVDSIPNAPEASGSDTTADGSNPSESDKTPGANDVVVFTECDEMVYVIDVKMLNLRSTPDFDDDSAIVETVEYGAELRRIGVSTDGVWSKVVYENNEYFASSKYLANAKPDAIVFTDCNETVYVNQDAYYRSIPSMADSAMVDTLAKGTAIKRTGVMYENPDDPEKLGWSRVEIEGKVYYMRNSVLTTTAPAAPETTPESAPATTPETTPQA